MKQAQSPSPYLYGDAPIVQDTQIFGNYTEDESLNKLSHKAVEQFLNQFSYTEGVYVFHNLIIKGLSKPVTHAVLYGTNLILIDSLGYSEKSPYQLDDEAKRIHAGTDLMYTDTGQGLASQVNFFTQHLHGTFVDKEFTVYGMHCITAKNVKLETNTQAVNFLTGYGMRMYLEKMTASVLPVFYTPTELIPFTSLIVNPEFWGDWEQVAKKYPAPKPKKGKNK